MIPKKSNTNKKTNNRKGLRKKNKRSKVRLKVFNKKNQNFRITRNSFKNTKRSWIHQRKSKKINNHKMYLVKWMILIDIFNAFIQFALNFLLLIFYY